MENTDKKIIEEKLGTLLTSYESNKKDFDKLKKIVDNENKEIKELMQEGGITEFESGGIVAKVSVSERAEFNEEALIKKLRDMKILEAIKIKETVDFTKLEDLIYNGRLSAAELAECQIIKKISTLRIK